MKTKDIQEIVTARIVAALENGTAPWRKPWKGSTIPHNVVTGKPYQGVNWFLLSMLGGGGFLTYKQAQCLGGNVRKGEKGCPIIFWSFTEKEKPNGEIGKVAFLRSYTVFSVSQCDGLELPAPEGEGEGEAVPFVPIERAEEIITNTGAEISHGGNRAFYRPATDQIQMPNKEAFHAPEEYYSTAFHELAHWTGHPSRLARKGIEDVAAFGSATYSKEELIAEMGAAFLCAEHGIDSTLENSAAYLRGWIKALKGDSGLAISAASAASKAANFILGKTTKEA
jgi:antirestriction protein ArdC